MKSKSVVHESGWSQRGPERCIFAKADVTALRQQKICASNLQLMFGTANVRTLHGGIDEDISSIQGVNTGLHVQALECMFSEQGFDLVAIQEGRAKHDQLKPGGSG